MCRIIRHLGSGIVNANDSATLSAAELGVVDCVTESTRVQRGITAVKDWEIIADRLSKAGWSCGWKRYYRGMSAEIVSSKEPDKWTSWDRRSAVVLKVVQIGAFFFAGLWALFGAYSLYKKEAARSATYGCPATTALRVEQIPGGDGQKSLYLVTVNTVVRNDTDRLVPIRIYTLDFYVGKTLAGPSPGFLVQKPTEKLDHPTIDWKLFDQYAHIQQGDDEMLERMHDNKEEPKIRLERVLFLLLPVGQSWPFENQFVISASENDWIATRSLIIYAKGPKEIQIVPETRVENIGVALRRGSEIAPKSSPPSTNPGSRTEPNR